MIGLTSLFFVFLVMVAVLGKLMRGPRDRAHRFWSDPLDALGVPTGGFSVAVLGALAVGALLPAQTVSSAATAGSVTGLDQAAHTRHMLVVSAAAFALGLAASQMTLVLMAAGVAVTSLGLAATAEDVTAFMFLIAPMAVFGVVTKAFGRLLT